jgi:dUTP pyrophosphatase
MKKDFNYLDTAFRMYLAGTSKEDVLNFMNQQVELNDIVPVRVYREDKRIPLPVYGKEGDACCDVYATSIEYDEAKDRWIVHTGLHFALPDEYEMELRPRSSNTKTELYVPNAPGTLDWGYRGELLIIFKRRTNVHLFRAVEELKDCVRGIPGVGKNRFLAACSNELDKAGFIFPYRPISDDYEGDRICQLLVRRREKIQWEEVETIEELGSTERGEKGFGSTGGDGETKTEEAPESEKVEEVDNEPAKVSGTTQNRFAK